MSNHRVAILGAGKSGLAAAALAVSHGMEVFVSDRNMLSASQAQTLESLGVDFEAGEHSHRLFDFPLWVLSPGISPWHPLVQQAYARGIVVWSEIDFARQFLTVHPRFVGVTGTNGKTTTSAMIHWILRRAGYDAKLAGNIGTPLSAVVNELTDDSVVVLELSSYQLQQSQPLDLSVAVWLNFSPDHLSYHRNLEQYFLAKCRIFCSLSARNFLILNSDDPKVRVVARWAAARIAFFGRSPVQQGMAFDDHRIVWMQQHKEEEFMARNQLPLPGAHNVYNSMAAALAARALEISNEDLRDSLKAFLGVEHRLEFVASVENVDYYNDSKATNVNAAWYAIESFERPVVWIAGGQESQQDYSALEALVAAKVRALVAMGEEAERLVRIFSNIPAYQVRSMEEAVALAHCLAQPGDVVLLSPACKSFDMFVNFEHRGEVFKEAVYQLKQQLEKS